MTKLEQIEKSILELSPDELHAFADWFEEMQERSFDDAIERDVKGGKLNTLAEKALRTQVGSHEATLKHQATPDFWRLYDALPNRVKTLADQNFGKLKSDPYHPSLHFKQVGDFWSARVGVGWRAHAVRDNDQFAWFWIGSHADYDKLLKR